MIPEITASDLIHQNLTEYAQSQVKANHPTAVDGLKPVLRRIINAIRNMDGQTKSAKLVAATMEDHPHGDQSIYQAVTRLGRTTAYNPTLLVFESDCGSYANPKPAGMRYTNGELTQFAREIFFEGIEYTAIPKEHNAVLEGFEPVYLIPSIPTALLYANYSIGYGESSYTIPHNLGDVCDLTVEFCRHQKHAPLTPFDYKKHVEKFLPDFPSFGTLTNRSELIAAYLEGDFSHRILLDGIVNVSSDTIQIKTLPFGQPFDGLAAKIEDLMRQKDSWFDQNIKSVKDFPTKKMVNGVETTDLTYGDVSVEVKRGVNIFEAWEMLRKRISFSCSYCPILNYNDGGYVVQVSQPHLLRLWYDARYNILVSSKKLKFAKLTDEIRRVEARLIVCDHTDDVVRMLRTNEEKVSVQLLQDQYGLTLFQAMYVVDTRLGVLSKDSRGVLEKRKVELETALRELRDSFAKIPDEMAEQALVIKKKYPTPRRTKIPAYIGYVKIGGGCVQIDSVDEIPQIIAAFPKDDLEIYIYDGKHHYRVTENNKLEMGYIPKVTMGDIYGISTDLEANPRSGKVITVNIAKGIACCVKGFIPGLRKEGYFYTTPRSKAIRRDGSISTIEVVEEISPRKTICTGAKTDIIYVYPEPKRDHYVFGLNTSTPNIIAIQRVSPERTKIAMNPNGQPYVVHSTERHFFLNIPTVYRLRNTTRVVEFVDIEAILDGKDHARLDINTADVKRNKHIRLL